MTITVTEKRCPRCGETKSVDGFSRNRSQHDGLCSQCKDCSCAYSRAYNEAHREEILAYSRAYNEAHREERRAYSRAYYEAHREEQRAVKRAYNEAHREEIRAYHRDRRALLGDPRHERWQEITAKHATRRGRWSEAEDAYLAASTDRIADDALALKRTYASVSRRLSVLRSRGITLARDRALAS